jgi:hypothetical protein
MPRPSGAWDSPRATMRWGASPVMSLPANRTRPRCGRTRPLTARRVVVLPAPVGADQRDHLALVDRERHPAQGLDAAVGDVELVDDQERHQPSSPATGAGSSGTPR